MNILQGLKLRRDLCICRGESGGEGLGGDTAIVATVVCLGVRGSQAWKLSHTYCVCVCVCVYVCVCVSVSVSVCLKCWSPFFDGYFCNGLVVTFLHMVTRATCKNMYRMSCSSLACMAKPVSMHSCRLRGRVALTCMRVCVCYGLVTGTCLHCGTARGRLSKNNLNPRGERVLSSILSRPLWPRLEGLEVEVLLGRGFRK